MKLNTTKAVIATVLATAFAGISATAIAQGMGMSPELHAQHMAQRGTPGAGAMDPARMAERHKQMAERHAQRMEQLKAELKITPAQDAAWKAFVARTEPTPPKAPAAAQDWSKLTTPQRLDAMQAMHAERSAEMAKRIDATKSFYAQLSPEQQKTFDAQHSGFHRAGMKGGEHRHGGKAGHGGQGHQGMDGGMGCHGGGGAQS